MEKKTNLAMKILILTMLGSYLLIYLGPLGAYYAQKYARTRYEEEYFYLEARAELIALVGGLCILAMIIWLFLKVDFKVLSPIVTILLGMMQIICIVVPHSDKIFLIGKNWYGMFPIAGIGRFQEIYEIMRICEDTFPMNMAGLGIGLFIIAVVLNIGLIILGVVEFILHIRQLINKEKTPKSEKKQVLRKPVVKFINISGRAFNILFGITYGVFLIIVYLMNFFPAYLNVYFSPELVLVISIMTYILQGYILPLLMFLIVFGDRWIRNGKWILVSISYIVLCYITYAALQYNLSLYLFYDYYLFDPDIMTRCVSGVIIICAFIIGILGIVEKIVLKVRSNKE